jgi:hypothetical protein
LVEGSDREIAMKRFWSEQRPHRQPGAKRLSVVLALAAAVTLQACADTPKTFSYLDGYRWSRAELNTYDTTIIAVDGKSYPYNTKIMVDPGLHHIVFETAPVAGFKFSPDKTLDIDIKPCTRYWFEAKRLNALEQDFVPRVNYTERIFGCGAEASNTGAGTGY